MPGTGAPSPDAFQDELLDLFLLAGGAGHLVGDPARNDAHTVWVAGQHIAGEHRDAAAGDRILHGGSEMGGQAGGRGAAGTEGRKRDGGDRCRVAHRAVGHERRDPAHHEPGDQDVSQHPRTLLSPAVANQHLAGRAGLDGLALRVFRIGQNLRRAEVLAHGNGAQRISLRREADVLRIERAGALDESVAQAALEQLHGDRGDAHGAQSIEGVVGQRLV